MSADDFTMIKKKSKKYIIVYGCASNDYTTEKGTFDTLEDAIKLAQSLHTEYGISFDLDTPPNKGKG